MSLPLTPRGWLFALYAASVLAITGCVADPASSTGEPIGETYRSFADFEASLPRDPNDGAYLVEGDIPVHDRATLETYYTAHDQPNALIVNKRDDGANDRWSDAQKMNLTYCVSMRFGSDHAAVVSAMESAGGDWADAAAVRFVYHGEEDAACTAQNDRVVFEVVPTSGTPYNARSFFPSLAAEGHHQLFIDMENVAQAAPKTLTGVLRHELGHVLGFRHEHARPESNGVCAEGPDWRALTPYDPESVMHYNAQSPCAGANTGDYVLSPLDKVGAAKLYGPPGENA